MFVHSAGQGEADVLRAVFGRDVVEVHFRDADPGDVGEFESAEALDAAGNTLAWCRPADDGWDDLMDLVHGRGETVKFGLRIAPDGAGLFIGVVEWSSDAAMEPAVFLGSEAAIRRQAAMLLSGAADRGEVDYVDPGSLPAPDFDDPAAVQEWLDDFRAATTDGWLTLYRASDRVGSDTFHDLRDA